MDRMTVDGVDLASASWQISNPDGIESPRPRSVFVPRIARNPMYEKLADQGERIRDLEEQLAGLQPIRDMTTAEKLRAARRLIDSALRDSR